MKFASKGHGTEGRTADARDDTSWRVFRAIVSFVPIPVILVSALTGQWLTVGMLATVALGAQIVFRWVPGRAAKLHGVIALLMGYQGTLLFLTAQETNIGLVWFFSVPVIAGTLGQRAHILFWTPAVLVAMVLCAGFPAQDAWASHPSSLSNLIATTLVISAAGYGAVVDRERRRAALEQALQEARHATEEQAQAAETAREAERRVSVFLAMMSHELRTPMTSILLSAELLFDRSADDETRRAADDARRSAEGLLVLLNDALDLAKIKSGKMVVHEAAFDLAPLLEDVFSLLSPLARAAGTRLFVGSPPTLEPTWVGDASRLRQVLTNLASNAIKNTAHGAVCVSVARSDAGLRFAVRDTGVGIEPEQVERIFDPYVQLKSNVPGAGTGLGLSIARSFVQAMGGEISVQSVPGEGSLFEFDVKMQSMDAPLASPSADLTGRSFHLQDERPEVISWATAWLEHWGAHIDQAGSRFSIRERLPFADYPLRELLGATQPQQSLVTESAVLPRLKDARGTCGICDDDPVIRRSLARVMGHYGYQTHCVSSGSELIEAVSEGRVDFVLLDVQLHNESGLEALRVIRQMKTPHRSVPVCIVSGSSLQEEEALAAGADAYLLKPPSGAELVTVAATLQRKASQRRLEARGLGTR